MHSQPIAHSLFECDQAQKTPYDKAKAERTHAFIEDKGMVPDEHNAMPFGEVYSDYQKWCLDNAVDPMKKREFNGILGRKFRSVKRSSMYWKARYTKYREL